MIKIVERTNKIDKDEAIKIAKKLDTTKEVIELLINRGYNENELDLYIQNKSIYQEPFNSLTNTDKAVEIISSYIEDDNAEIYIFADYDADGINAGYVATGVLKALKESLDSNVKINTKYPNRIEGYGLNMLWCKKTFPTKSKKKRLVITVDNGVTKKEEVEYLKTKNVETIITDHHAPILSLIPNCLVIDAHLNDKEDANGCGLCGTAVIYKVMGRLLEYYKDESEYILNYLPNVAIATITDMMPATPENIGFVKHGLWLIDNGYANSAINYYKTFVNKHITVKDLAFEIGPQINACGRMGKIEKAASFMSAEKNIEDLYNEMLCLNDERKELEKSILKQIEKVDLSDSLVVVLHIEDLGGLGGTVASKVLEKYNRPVILFSGRGDVLHGSARSINNIDLHVLLEYQVEQGNLISFGGHSLAAGVCISKDKLKDFTASINNFLASYLVDSQGENVAEEDMLIEVDKTLNLKDINKNVIAPYLNLTCFGDLKEPVFAINDVDIIEARTSANNPDHLCLNLKDKTIKETKNRYGKIVGKEIWMWNKMPYYKRIGEPKKVHLITKLVPDFRNPKYYTLDVLEIIPA